jgi:hypothetical protein
VARQPEAELFIVPEASHQFGGRHPWPEAELPPLARLVAERTATFFQQHA